MTHPRAKRPPLFAATPTTVGGVEHPWYRACRDHSTKRDVRVSLSRLWNAHGHLLPEDAEQFVDQFRRDFPARSWELYILGWLARSGSTIERAPGKGPDFCATHPRIGRFWIECVVPTIGEGANRVWQRPPDVRIWSGPPDEPIELRYTAAIQAKIAKVAKYREQGIVAASEPVIIALNQGAILDSDLNDIELPLAMRILYGVGGTVMTVEIGTGATNHEVRYRTAIENSSGASVSTFIFGEKTSSVVAGVILARHNIFNLYPGRRRRLIMGHNPLAASPIPIGALPFRGELWVDDQYHLAHRGVVSPYGRFSRAPRGRPTFRRLAPAALHGEEPTNGPSRV
jgi:hypothetical protein